MATVNYSFVTTVFVLLFPGTVSNSTETSLNADDPRNDVLEKAWKDQFQVVVEGFHKLDQSSIEAVIYYDRVGNQAAIVYDHDEEEGHFIYKLNDKVVLKISDSICSVEELPETPARSYIHYSVNSTGNMIIGPPQDIFFFKESAAVYGGRILDSSGAALRYWITKDLFIPMYNATCTLFHFFSDPEAQNMACGTHFCNVVPMKINATCTLTNEEGKFSDTFVYNFVQFKDFIEDMEVFLPPRGVVFENAGKSVLPVLPNYFSLEVDTYSKDQESESIGSVSTLHKQVWYDAEKMLIRRDDFTSERLIQSSNVYDFNSEVAYAMTSILPCTVNNITELSNSREEDVIMIPSGMLPGFLTSQNHEAVYVGKRKQHNMEFEMWSLSSKDKDGGIQVTDLFYFPEIPEKTGFITKAKLLPAFVEGYSYYNGEVQGYSYQQFSNFRSVPRDWTAFDVSACFKPEHKLKFQLEIKGPNYIKGSKHEAFFLEKLELILLQILEISVIRVSEMQISSGDKNITTVSATLLEHPNVMGYGKNTCEKRNSAAYKQLESAVKSGKFQFKFNVPSMDESQNVEMKYLAVSIKEISKDEEKVDGQATAPSFPVFQTAVQGIHKEQNAVVNAMLYYDSESGRATVTYEYNGVKAAYIYDIDKDVQISLRQGNNAIVEKLINEPSESFITYKKQDAGLKVMPSGEEALLFKKGISKLKGSADWPTEDLSFIKANRWVTTNVAIPLFSATCDLSHIFSEPLKENLTCGDHFCRVAPVNINGLCKVSPIGMPPSDLTIIYNFAQFKDYIENPEVFQTQPGVYIKEVRDVDAEYTKLPLLPSYFSFNFDTYSSDVEAEGGGVGIDHKEVWYDSNMRLIRRDDFDLNLRLLTSTIFDWSSQVQYTISNNVCTPSNLTGLETIEQMALLPSDMFPWNPNKRPVPPVIWNVGKRMFDRVLFDTWSISSSPVDPDDDSAMVSEIYYTKDPRDVTIQLLPQFIQNYRYAVGDDGDVASLDATAYQHISSFRTRPRDWTAFDVSACYKPEHKIGFALELNGPDYQIGSIEEMNLFESLELHLLEATDVSLVRFSEMQFEKLKPGSVRVTGIILEPVSILGVGSKSGEISMETAYRNLETAVNDGKIKPTLKTGDDKEETFKVENLKRVTPGQRNFEEKKEGPCYGGGSMAGMAFSMLIVGLFIGLISLIMYIRYKRGTTWREAIA